MSEALEETLKEAISAMERYLKEMSVSVDRSKAQDNKNLLKIALMVKRNIVFREKIIPEILAPGPMWRILIEIYIAESKNTRISITDAALVSNIALTTSLRYTNILENAKLIFRKPDLSDKRRNWLHLTNKGVFIIENVLGNIFDCIRDCEK